jgi:hypothetical protein
LFLARAAEADKGSRPNRFNMGGWSAVSCHVTNAVCLGHRHRHRRKHSIIFMWAERNTPLPCVSFASIKGGGAVDCHTLQCTDLYKIPAGRIFKFALALRCTVFSYVVRTYRSPRLWYEFEEQRSAIKARRSLAKSRKLMQCPVHSSAHRLTGNGYAIQIESESPPALTRIRHGSD